MRVYIQRQLFLTTEIYFNIINIIEDLELFIYLLSVHLTLYLSTAINLLLLALFFLFLLLTGF